MSIYSVAESGTQQLRSRFTKSISYNIQYNCKFGELIPVCRKFVLPGDVWRIGGQALVRLQPMLTPPMNKMLFKVRYFFVPLRLVEPNCELILTGSKDGHLYEVPEGEVFPEFDNFVAHADKTETADAYVVQKYGFYDYLGCQCLDYEAIKDDMCLPAAYWRKGYLRIKWDYYDDENIGSLHNTYDEFEDLVADDMKWAAHCWPHSVSLPKDYFTSALPWQLKAPAAPFLEVEGKASMTVPDFFKSEWPSSESILNQSLRFQSDQASVPPKQQFTIGSSDAVDINNANTKWKDYFDEGEISITGLGFDGAKLRDMMAQTRIFERLARTGSRYTEYLRANFGTAPADDTLQRAQYLGGWKLPIVTTEVLQTAADGSTPVGTMRGHGITNGGNRIQTFFAKEFGLLFGLAHVLPEIKYKTGIPRELSYKRRFEFFNPSFQHLSEQEIRNGELFISNSDGKNDDTFGFQAYANELRSSQNIIVADMRDTMDNWNQGINFAARPNLNSDFIEANNYSANFNKPFAVSGTNARPLIIDFQNIFDVYRPMVKYATPGLVDHL